MVGLNCASYAGMKSAGILGAVAANIGVLTPSFTLCIAAAIFFEKAKSSRIMANILVGIRPACIGLMLGVVLSLCLTNYFSNSGVDLWAIFIGLMSLYLVVGKNMDIPHVICISALLGIIIYAPGSIFNALLCCQRQWNLIILWKHCVYRRFGWVGNISFTTNLILLSESWHAERPGNAKIWTRCRHPGLLAQGHTTK